MAFNQILIAGAGFAGSVCARQLADAGQRVVVIDRRDHIGGNAFDRYDSAGVLIHPYGPHIFHTNDKGVFQYLSRFTDWRFYEHRVQARIGDRLVPFPINITTLNEVLGLKLILPGEMETYLHSVRTPVETVSTSEDVLLSTIGRHLTNTFFRGYTRKQWGLDLSELSASVAARIPYRTNDDDRYFTDTYQFMPNNGYGSLFCELLRHPLIDIRLNTDFDDLHDMNWKHILYTGPIDEYFKHCLGKLPYRSLRFEHEHIALRQKYQPVATVNEPDYTVPHTRTTEFKHMTGQVHLGTSICREYPTAVGDPYYPVPNADNQKLYKRYEKLAEQTSHVTFLGRLGTYKYYNMDQVVAQALAASKKFI
jgi:UDP-galactopyranose mutase